MYLFGEYPMAKIHIDRECHIQTQTYAVTGRLNRVAKLSCGQLIYEPHP